MHRALADCVLTTGELRVPAYAEVDLAGRTVREVLARGKHMLTRFDDGTTLHTHFRMDGSWWLAPSNRRPNAGRQRHARRGPAHQIRALLVNGRYQAIRYLLHDIRLLPTAEEDSVVSHLGPDILGPDWDSTRAVVNLYSDPDRRIADALLDQRNLAGIGNLYATETLFLTGHTPWRPVGEITDLGAVVARARALMRANRQHPEQSTTGSLRRGELHWVYRRDHYPCRRCGGIVQTGATGVPPQSRVAYWCPHCQIGPSAAVDSRPTHSSSSRATG